MNNISITILLLAKKKIIVDKLTVLNVS